MEVYLSSTKGRLPFDQEPITNFRALVAEAYDKVAKAHGLPSPSAKPATENLNRAESPDKPPILRQVSVEELIRFARDNHGRRFLTLGRKRPYRIFWEDEVVYRPESGTPFYPNLDAYVELYNKSRSLTPSHYDKELWCNSYFVSTVNALLRAAPVSSKTDTPDDIEIIVASTTTEREELIKCRLGQGKFRAALLRGQNACYVTGIRDARLLRASHIKPWRDSTNAERLDPDNGLLLTPLFDHLFDQRLISFSDDGTMLFAPSFSEKTFPVLGMPGNFQGTALSAKTRAYLAHHRDAFFRLHQTS